MATTLKQCEKQFRGRVGSNREKNKNKNKFKNNILKIISFG
jgi:hypothetical protein